jgi:hypothetical protein
MKQKKFHKKQYLSEAVIESFFSNICTVNIVFQKFVFFKMPPEFKVIELSLITSIINLATQTATNFILREK